MATELATNLVKYGSAGELLVGTFADETGTGVEILALDKGGGLGNLDDALRDGHSTGGSSGTGLGSVRRQSQVFGIVSWPGRGAAVLARIGAGAPDGSMDSLSGGVAVPLRGETVNGDAYAIGSRGAGWTVIVADGLGHGPSALPRLRRKRSGSSLPSGRRTGRDPLGGPCRPAAYAWWGGIGRPLRS